jgi:hypothetical protein
MTADRDRAMQYARREQPGFIDDADINLARAHIEVSEELSDARLEISSLKDAERTDLAELTRLGEENERLVKALHPGPMPGGGVNRDVSGATDIWEAWRCHSSTDGVFKDALAWCSRANAYEAATGRRVDE